MSGTSVNRPAEDARRWDAAALLLMVGLVVLAAFTYGHYGMSYDEHFSFIWGEAKLDYYQQLFGDDQASETEVLQSNVHPGLFDLTWAILRRISPLGDRDTGHLLAFGFGLLGLGATWRSARLAGGPSVGFWAVFILATLPRYYGHMWFNPKDIPFAALYALGLWATLAAVRELPEVRWSRIAFIGVATGLALGVRVAGLLIPFYFILGCGVWLLQRLWQERAVSGEAIRLSGILILQGLFMGVVAYAVAWPWWFQLHGGGVDAALGSLERAQSFDFVAQIVYGGEIFMSNELPRDYLLAWLVITTPELYLLLLGSGILLVLLALRARARSPGDRWDLMPILPVGLVMIALLFPLAYVFLRQPVLYDGLRHFLFLLPPLALLCGLVLRGWLSLLRQANRFARYAWALPALILVQGLFVAREYSVLHPYEYVYFNSLVGGLAGAHGAFETDYWALSYRECFAALEAYIEEKERMGELDKERYRLALAGAPWLAAPFVDEKIQVLPREAPADFYISFTRSYLHLLRDGRPIYVVERDGIPLAVVLELTDGPTEEVIEPAPTPIQGGGD